MPPVLSLTHQSFQWISLYKRLPCSSSLPPQDVGVWDITKEPASSINKINFGCNFFFDFFFFLENFFECGCKICLKTNQMMPALQKGYYEL